MSGFSPSARFGRIETRLRQQSARGLGRRLSLPQGLDFSSNDYLGLAHSPALRAVAEEALARGVAAGAGGSRLLRGHHEEHAALEAEAARFFGASACLLINSGYTGNLALMSLPRRGDLVIRDELVHASMHDGLRETQAEIAVAAHNDATSFRDLARRWRQAGGSGTIWLAVESLYSMDGDCAPLDDLMQIAEEQDGFLIVDEAHSTGVFGPNGRGLAAHLEGREALIALHTGGKALGCTGALITADRRIVDTLINRARAFIYATSLPPMMAAILCGALGILQNEPDRRKRLRRLMAYAAERLGGLDGVVRTGTQIMPLMVGDSARSVLLAQRLQAAGFDCRAVRPPTVPNGTARLRFSITLNVDEAAIDSLVDAVSGILRHD